MNGASVICEVLKSYGIKKVFVYPGGTVAPLLHELDRAGISIHCFRNEQGAGYAAIGAAKVSGKSQVVIVTSGPGATNVVTPVADAYYDSVPLMVFTGQVATSYINFEKKLRQTGFQETDVVSIFESISKKVFILMPESDLCKEVAGALDITVSGRPGPVVVDLPMDTQRMEIENHSGFRRSQSSVRNRCTDDASIGKFISLLNMSRKPVVIGGSGVLISNAVKELRAFVDETSIPVVSSMPAVGIMPVNHPLYFSFLGHTGEFYANLAVYYSDMILVLGSRLDIRQLGNRLDVFENKRVVRVDIDSNEIEFSRVRSFMHFNTDVREFLGKVLACGLAKVGSDEWISTLRGWREKYDSSQFYRGDKLFMRDVIRYVSEKCKDKRVVVSSGVGGHQQMVARYFEFDFPQRRWMTSAGHGTMGFDLPAMLGVFLEEKYDFDFGLVFVGDGSFQMNIQELATLKEIGVPVKIFVLDDKRLGIVSQFQLLNWGKDPTTGNKNNPSFSEIARAYGIESIDVFSKEELEKINGVFCDRSPWLVHCHIDSGENVLPMLLADQELNEMYPFGKVVYNE